MNIENEITYKKNTLKKISKNSLENCKFCNVLILVTFSLLAIPLSKKVKKESKHT